MTTIPSRWLPELHCRLVSHAIATWRDIVWIIRWVAAMFSQFSTCLSRITRHSFYRLCQSTFLEESCRILSGFRKVLIGNTIVTCLESIHRANKCTFSIIDVYFIFSCYPELDVFFFVMNTCSNNKWKLKYSPMSGFLDRIIKRSAGEKPSAPSW